MREEDLFEPRLEIPIDETESDLCRALWIAVTIQAMIDATSKSRKKSAIKARSQALQWLSRAADDKSDFSMVCDLTGIDCKKLRKKFQEVLKKPEASIDFRCLKKAGIDNRGTESRKRYFARARKNELLREARLTKQHEDAEPIAEVASISPLCELPKNHSKEIKHAS